MATITNSLVTVLRLVGQAQYARGLVQTAAASQALAVSTAQQAAAAKQLAAAQQNLASVSADVLLGSILAVAAATTLATHAAIEWERAMIRANVVFRNRGINVSGVQAGAMALQVSQATGVAPQEVLDTEAYLARFRVGAQNLSGDLRILANMSLITGKSMQESAHAVEMAHMGSSKSLRDMGIFVHQMKGFATDMQSIFRAIDLETRGMAATLRNTMPGQFMRMIASFQSFLIALGEANAGPLYSTFRAIADTLDFITRHMLTFVRLLEAATVLVLTMRYGWAGLATGLAIIAGIEIARARFGNLGNAAAGAAGPRSRMEEYARQTAFNTGPQGPLGHALRSGGSFGEPGGGLRIRDYNQMARKIG